MAIFATMHRCNLARSTIIGAKIFRNWAKRCHAAAVPPYVMPAVTPLLVLKIGRVFDQRPLVRRCVACLWAERCLTENARKSRKFNTASTPHSGASFATTPLA